MKKELAAIYSIDEKILWKNLSKIDIENYDRDTIESFFDWCKKHKIKYLFKKDIKWKKVEKIPHIIYYKWNINLLNKKIIAIVWPRNCSNYAKSILEKVFEEISKYSKEIVTISGLADGIDKLCHNLSIKYNIPTIAVLWWWFWHYLNNRDRFIIEKIEKNWGLIISEFKIKFKPTRWSFPQRNRIIAWFSDILFIPQAKKKSWTLITVNFAIEQNIPIYSCLSHIFDINGNGSNELIINKKIIPIIDIKQFEKYLRNTLKIKKERKRNLSKTYDLNWNQKLIIKHIINNDNNTIENISYKTGLNTQKILQEISEMEILWLIKQESNGNFNLY